MPALPELGELWKSGRSRSLHVWSTSTRGLTRRWLILGEKTEGLGRHWGGRDANGVGYEVVSRMRHELANKNQVVKSSVGMVKASRLLRLGGLWGDGAGGIGGAANGTSVEAGDGDGLGGGE